MFWKTRLPKSPVPVSLSLAAVGVAPLGNITDPSAKVNRHGLESTQSFFEAQICAFQYRKIRRSSIDASRLSKSPRWSSVEKGRDEEDRQDDIIEVEAIPVDGLNGEWDTKEVEGG